MDIANMEQKNGNKQQFKCHEKSRAASRDLLFPCVVLKTTNSAKLVTGQARQCMGSGNGLFNVQ